MTRHRLTIVAAVTAFFVLAGTGVASALWSTPASVTSTVEVATLSDDCTDVVTMLNPSFENPLFASGVNYRNGAGGSTGMEGWRSRTLANGPARIEIWKSGTTYDGLPSVIAPVGTQFVELNADEPGVLYQDLATPTAGQTLQWSFLHRGRMGSDTMELLIGTTASPVVQNTFTDDYVNRNGNGGWVRYSGAYVVPEGQQVTRLAFRSVSSGSLGNFLDDVSFGSGPCVAAQSTATNSAPKSATTPVVSGDTVTYSTTVSNSGSSPAVSTALSWSIPAGLEYVAGSLTIGGVAGGSVSGNVLTAPVGASGSLAQGTSVVVAWKAKVTATVGTTFAYTPSIAYANGLAAGWKRVVVAANVPITVADGSAPTAPGAPSLTGRTKTSISLTWAASSDDVAVTVYRVYRDGTLAGTTTSNAPGFTDAGRTAGASHSYTIRALDAAGNVSVASAATILTSALSLSSSQLYKLNNVRQNSSFCVDATSGSTTPGTAVLVFYCEQARSYQKWSFVENSEGYYAIKTSYSALVLGPSATGRIDIQTSTGAATQQWELLPDSGGKVRFKNRSTASCIATAGNSSTEPAWNAPLQLYPCDSGIAQTFTMSTTN